MNDNTRGALVVGSTEVVGAAVKVSNTITDFDPVMCSTTGASDGCSAFSPLLALHPTDLNITNPAASTSDDDSTAARESPL